MSSSLQLLVCLSSQLIAYLWSVVLAQIKSTHSLFQEREDIELYSSVSIRSDFQAKPQTTSPNTLLWKATIQPEKEDSNFPQETVRLMWTRSSFSIKSFFVGWSPYFSRKFPRAGERPPVTEQVICCEDTFLPNFTLISSIIMSRVSSALTSIVMADSCFKKQWDRSLEKCPFTHNKLHKRRLQERTEKQTWQNAVDCFKQRS